MRIKLIEVSQDPEGLIARCARVSHRSEGKASPEADAKLIRRLIELGHDSVLEFASATFLIEGISRAAANQLTRHRLASFVQESQRYVDVRDQGLVRPPSFPEEGWRKASQLYQRALELYEELVGEGVPKEDARFVLPIGAETRLVMRANFRELRHIIRLRGSRAAQWEIRELARRMLEILREVAPNAFFDLEVER
ncbi:FAD-dependent thymidylate synthase [Candidatus Bipolaricaulota bacterium]|nr:FAD-dependent thymidylate synthase [Candidatus Bipolaricaulota bacterium]